MGLLLIPAERCDKLEKRMNAYCGEEVARSGAFDGCRETGYVRTKQLRFGTSTS